MLKTGILFGSYGYDRDRAEVAQAIGRAGFDTVFLTYRDDAIVGEISSLADRNGIAVESLHAPFGGISEIWAEGEEGEIWVDRLISVAKCCARFGIPYFTVHATNVPRRNENTTRGRDITSTGLDRFRRVAEYAAGKGVVMSFENLEFPQCELKQLMELLPGEFPGTIGFTWDIGHWNCYPADLDFENVLVPFLVGTHVADNFGVKDTRVITWEDDLHLLPFDGSIDYRIPGEIMRRSGYGGSVTLEVGRKDIKKRYMDYPDLDCWLADCHSRAERLAKMWSVEGVDERT